LGWDNVNQKNQVQVKKSNYQDIAGKIGTQNVNSQNSQQVLKPVNPGQYSNQNYEDPRLLECTYVRKFR